MPLRAGILTLEPNELGGVQVLTRSVYEMLEAQGWEPTVIYAVNAGPDVSLGERLRFTRKLWRAEPREYPHGPDPFAGLRTRAVAAPPFPFWLYHLVPQFTLGKALAGFDRLVVVSGSAHPALPLALRGMPYLLWIATDYEEELRSKVETGDPWAEATLNTWSWKLLAAQERHAVRKATKVLTFPHTADLIGQKWPDVAPKTRSILFPVDTDYFRPAGEPRQESPYGRYLLLIARISDPRKNVAMLLDALARVRREHPDLKLVTVGGSPTEALVRQRDALELQGAVHFVEERVSRQELVRLYQDAELFVLSSLQEGLAISVLEAIACGTPVVATRCGGPESLIHEGETGQLVANNDPDTLANAIVGLLKDPARLEAMRERCVTYARQNFARNVVEEQFLAAVDAAFDGDAPRNPLWRQGAAVGWVVLVAVLYFVRQVPPAWPKVYERFVAPLLGR